MKHTTGPWTSKKARTAIHIGPGQSGHVATVSLRNMDEAEQEANAKLIAAAPELLAACDELLEGMIPGEKHNTANVTLYAIGMIREAIRKATTL